MCLRGLSPAFRSAVDAARDRPAFALFLAALVALPFRWLSPLGPLYERAGWTDVFLAGAAMLWGLERMRAWQAGHGPRLRAWHVALGLFLVLGLLSAVFSADRRNGMLNVVLMTELATAAILSADFGSSSRNRSAIALVVMGGALVTAALAAVSLALFYLDVRTGLIADYGELVASDLYARVKAGFYKPPLLASYCIFASAVIAMTGNGLPRTWRRITQLALAATVVVTFSRAVIGFLAALTIRAAAARRSRAWRMGATLAVAIAVALMAGLTLGTLELDPTHPTETRYRFSDEGVRYRELTTSLSTASDHPFLGIGPGELPGNDLGRPVRAHYTPANIAGTVGYPALAALIVAIALIWMRRPRPTEVAIWSGVLGLIIDGIGQDIDHFRHVWILIGLAAARAPDDDDPG